MKSHIGYETQYLTRLQAVKKLGIPTAVIERVWPTA
jgi:hypothetical protein